VIGYGFALNDPVSREAARSLALAGLKVVVCQLPADGAYPSKAPDNLRIEQCPPPPLPKQWAVAWRIARWIRFRGFVRRCIAKHRPSVVVTIMFHAFVALPRNIDCRIAACIYDIPALGHSGRLDKRIIQAGWRRLRQADLVWSSDPLKAALVQQYAKLPATPTVCRNVPRLCLGTESESARSSLRAELRRGGLPADEDSCILLRAGAIGPHGGIEETLEALPALPPNVLFLMMGRPSAAYKNMILKLISALNLDRRVAVWDKPSDETWQEALSGSDIGHLLHVVGDGAKMRKLTELNSPLSNYRLYSYMAAGLPIVVHHDPRLGPICKEVPCFEIVREANLTSDLIQRLTALATDVPLRQRLGKAGRTAYIRTYNWEAQFGPVADRIVALTHRQSNEPVA
jgi:glycosyltransferase involved in cell wall biosynthesis